MACFGSALPASGDLAPIRRPAGTAHQSLLPQVCGQWRLASFRIAGVGEGFDTNSGGDSRSRLLPSACRRVEMKPLRDAVLFAGAQCNDRCRDLALDAACDEHCVRQNSIVDR